jgi:carbamoyl-phosphate synthase large subunit
MPKDNIHVLMTGAGAPGAPGIIHCLKQDPRIHLTVSDADENATGRRLHDDFILLPKADQPDFIPRLLHICRELSIDCILPLVTRELFAFAQHQKEFEAQGTRVLVSSDEAISIANNKSSCYVFLRGKGLDVPPFFVVKDVEQFIHAAFELGHPKKPFVFKPSISNGSRGVRIVSDGLDETELLFNRKPYQLEIDHSQALRILSARPFPELLVSAYLPGDEYSVDCLANEGKAVLIAPRSRRKMINGISVQGEFVQDEAIIHYCREIIAAIGLHGNIGIQVKYGEDGKPYLLEINPRVQGTIVAALGAGVNLPLLAVKQAMGWEISPEEIQVRWGTQFARYWTEVFY